MFYSKLKEEIKDGIALAGVNQRDYNSLRGAAIIIDNRAEQRRKEVSRRTPGVRTFGGEVTTAATFSATSAGKTLMSQASAVQPSIATKEERNDRTPRRTPHPDPEREDLMRTGSCFNCKKPGHRAAECPLKTTHELDSVSENDLPPPKMLLGASNLISASSCLPNDACAPEPLVDDCVLSSMSKKIPLKVLIATGTTGYGFIDERTAQDVCSVLGIQPNPLSRPEPIRGFDGHLAKPITHAI